MKQRIHVNDTLEAMWLITYRLYSPYLAPTLTINDQEILLKAYNVIRQDGKPTLWWNKSDFTIYMNVGSPWPDTSGKTNLEVTFAAHIASKDGNEENFLKTIPAKRGKYVDPLYMILYSLIDTSGLTGKDVVLVTPDQEAKDQLKIWSDTRPDEGIMLINEMLDIHNVDLILVHSSDISIKELLELPSVE